MYRKMLVLLDGSKLAEVVFRYAQELSARLDINLELLHVCTPQEADQLPMRQAYMEHMAEILSNKTAEIRSRIGDKTASPKTKAALHSCIPSLNTIFFGRYELEKLCRFSQSFHCCVCLRLHRPLSRSVGFRT